MGKVAYSTFKNESDQVLDIPKKTENANETTPM